jgi:hypothetical protein
VKYCIRWVSSTASVQARRRPVPGFSGDIPRLPHPTPPPIPINRHHKTLNVHTPPPTVPATLFLTW